MPVDKLIVDRTKLTIDDRLSLLEAHHEASLSKAHFNWKEAIQAPFRLVNWYKAAIFGSLFIVILSIGGAIKSTYFPEKVRSTSPVGASIGAINSGGAPVSTSSSVTTDDRKKHWTLNIINLLPFHIGSSDQS